MFFDVVLVLRLSRISTMNPRVEGSIPGDLWLCFFEIIYFLARGNRQPIVSSMPLPARGRDCLFPENR